eukprot:TRINITY_DN3601_c0_g1_i2.p1 TRINITY_DN3601_c0_g1~~TRINITY_DN3601_c0_g1_i2.p1  ORF type:complete len:691 (+),score=111.26 TRINITY_DN3601_c0_g1_i2:152-2224(+)
METTSADCQKAGGIPAGPEVAIVVEKPPGVADDDAAKPKHGAWESTKAEQAASRTSLAAGGHDTLEFGSWLLEGGADGSFARSLRANSDAVKALQALEQIRRDAANGYEKPWILSDQADVISGLFIAAYAVLVGVDIEIAVRPVEISDSVKDTIVGLQVAFVVIFAVELVLRIRAHGWQFCSPFHNMAGFFDTLIIVLGTLDIVAAVTGIGTGMLRAMGVVRLFRLLRLLRIIRVLLVCKELKLLFVGMFTSLTAVCWAFVLLLMLMYLGTLLCAIMLGSHPSLKQYFGSIPMGLFTHFMICTMEAWPDVSDAVMAAAGDWWAVYFMAFICLSSLALMNLVTGVVCDKLLDLSGSMPDIDDQRDALAVYRQQADDFGQALQDIMKEGSFDGLMLKPGDFEEMLLHPRTKELIDGMEIMTDLSTLELFQVLDVEGAGVLSVEQLPDSLLRLRGSRRRLHSGLLQRDVIRGSRLQLRTLQTVTKNLKKATCQTVRTSSQTLLKHLENFAVPAMRDVVELAAGLAGSASDVMEKASSNSNEPLASATTTGPSERSRAMPTEPRQALPSCGGLVESSTIWPDCPKHDALAQRSGLVVSEAEKQLQRLLIDLAALEESAGDALESAPPCGGKLAALQPPDLQTLEVGVQATAVQMDRPERTQGAASSPVRGDGFSHEHSPVSPLEQVKRASPLAL